MMTYGKLLEYWMISEGENDIVETLDSLIESRRNQKMYEQDLRTGVMKRYREGKYVYHTWDQLVYSDKKPCYASLDEWREDEKADLLVEKEEEKCKLEYIGDLFNIYKNASGKGDTVNKYKEMRTVYKWYVTMKRIHTGSILLCKKESGNDVDIFLVSKELESYSLTCLVCGDVVKKADTKYKLLESYVNRIFSVRDDRKEEALKTLAGKYAGKLIYHKSGYTEIMEEKEMREDQSFDGPLNMFRSPMSEEKQIELSNALDDFIQAYESKFYNQIVEDDADETSYRLCSEFKGLYNLVDDLVVRALAELDSEIVLEEKKMREDQSFENPLNLFRSPMSEEKQIELSNALDDFIQVYENEFYNQIVEGDADETSYWLCRELKDLYNLVETMKG